MRRPVFMRLAGVLVIVVAALIGTGCGGGGTKSSRAEFLSGVAPLEEAFEADKGHARVILLLSPT